MGLATIAVGNGRGGGGGGATAVSTAGGRLMTVLCATARTDRAGLCTSTEGAKRTLGSGVGTRLSLDLPALRLRAPTALSTRMALEIVGGRDGDTARARSCVITAHRSATALHLCIMSHKRRQSKHNERVPLAWARATLAWLQERLYPSGLQQHLRQCGCSQPQTPPYCARC